MSPSITIRQLIEATASWVDVAYAGDTAERRFSRIDTLLSDSVTRSASDTLWIYLAADRSTISIELDRLILELAQHGAPGVAVVSRRLPQATCLLAERLQLPLMKMNPEAIGPFLATAYRLLTGAESQALHRELELLDRIYAIWHNNFTLRGFLDELAHEGLVVHWPSRSDDATYSVEWGRGRGSSFGISSPIVSPRIIQVLQLAVGVFLDMEAAEIESTLRHRSEILLELLVDPNVPSGSVIRAAERFNLDLGRIHTAFIWDLDNFSQYVGRSSEETVLRVKAAVLTHLENASRRVFGHGMVLPHSDEFVLIVESRERLSPDYALTGAREIRHELLPLLSRYGLFGVTGGIGFPYDGPEGLRKSFEEAHEALTVGRARYGFGTVAHFKDLGLERFLYGWLDSPRSRELSHGLLRPIVEDPNREELLETLRVYLSAMGRPAQAAQKLHIHRNTLRYRIERIESLLKVDLHDAATQLVLQLALRAYELHQN